MTDKEFSLRLAKLRTQKGVSARDMSLSMGQNPGYINNIETGKSMPSLSGFFYICDYLDITARDFFDDGNEYPEQLRAVLSSLMGNSGWTHSVCPDGTECVSGTTVSVGAGVAAGLDGRVMVSATASDWLSPAGFFSWLVISWTRVGRPMRLSPHRAWWASMRAWT